jgi:hypothetical protein
LSWLDFNQLGTGLLTDERGKAAMSQ